MTVQSKSGFLAFSLAIFVFTPTFSFGQATAAVSTPATVPSKIAFVNLQEAVVACNEGKQEAAALQQRFTSKQAALKTQDDELKKLKDDFQTVSAKLNEEERNARLRAIQDKQKAFERNYADYQAETQEAQQEAINKIVKKMLPVLEKYSTANGYTAVFDISNPQTPVLWVRKESMITKQLVDAYNAQSTARTPAAPAPSAGTPKP
jgi:outer membrane protein